MRSLLVVSLSLFSVVAFGNVRFAKRCEVTASPAPRANRLCEKPQGTPVTRFRTNGTYAQIETSDCNGFVLTSCLETDNDSGTATARRQPRTDRSPSSISETFHRIRLGPTLGGSGLFAKPQSTTASTNGYGFLVGAQVVVPLPNRFRLTASPNLQFLTLARTVDGTGAIVDATPAEFRQRVTFLGAALLGGYTFGSGELDGSRMAFSLDGGFEFLYPLSATQTDNFGTEIKFETKDKLLYVLLGPSAEFLLTRDLALAASLQFFYNLGSASGNSLMGGRLAAALSFLL